jgi:hypothetical protein
MKMIKYGVKGAGGVSYPRYLNLDCPQSIENVNESDEQMGG